MAANAPRPQWLIRASVLVAAAAMYGRWESSALVVTNVSYRAVKWIIEGRPRVHQPTLLDFGLGPTDRSICGGSMLAPSTTSIDVASAGMTVARPCRKGGEI